MGIWQSVNPRLPLISTLSIEKKIRDLLQLVKDINRKHYKAAVKRNLAYKLDSLFDINGAPVLWKCYHVMTEESTVMLITAN